MRTEQEMVDLIVKTATEDDRIRAAVIEGSRVNPDAPRDIFQDYDVAYVVMETASFQRDEQWIDRFGDRLYMQYPENSPFHPSDTSACFGWLMQLTDGVRLDLHVHTLEHMLEELADDPMYRILLDKDGGLPPPAEHAESHYWVKRPTEAQFLCTCNEFWWCLNNVAKGLWRGEIPYVMDMLNLYVRPMLSRLLAWKIGFETGFTVSVGKAGKYMTKWLPDALWRRYLDTYPAADSKGIWNAVFAMCDLVDETARQLTALTGFRYNEAEASNSRAFLSRVRVLPKDTGEIFEGR